VRYAHYTQGSGTYTLQFLYTVQEGDHVDLLDVRTDLDIVLPSQLAVEFYNEVRGHHHRRRHHY
jgi:hypothetical protein